MIYYFVLKLNLTNWMLSTYLIVILIIVKIDKQMQNEVWWYNYYLQNFTFQIYIFFLNYSAFMQWVALDVVSPESK